jgi:membrane-associated phospholipid phosphatase
VAKSQEDWLDALAAGSLESGHDPLAAGFLPAAGIMEDGPAIDAGETMKLHHLDRPLRRTRLKPSKRRAWPKPGGCRAWLKPSLLRARSMTACLLCILVLPTGAAGGGSKRAAVLPDGGAPADPQPLSTGARLTRLDAGLFIGGAALMSWANYGLSPEKRDVPREGLDADEIRFEIDRNSIRQRTHQPIDLGHHLLYGALVHPSLLAIASAREDERWSTGLQAMTRQAEAILLANGTSLVLKRIISRPRPYTYLPVYERSERGANWATSDQTFESFPSGHATAAWASATVAVSSLAMRRDDLSPTTHFLNGLAAGGLATSISLLRVEAGMHFPTDVGMGAVIGATAGTVVPLAHEGFHLTLRQSRSLTWGWLGIGTGCLVALLLTPPTSPWFD